MQRYGELQTHANKTAFVRLLRGGTARRLESVKPSDTGLIKSKVTGLWWWDKFLQLKEYNGGRVGGYEPWGVKQLRTSPLEMIHHSEVMASRVVANKQASQMRGRPRRASQGNDVKEKRCQVVRSWRVRLLVLSSGRRGIDGIK